MKTSIILSFLTATSLVAALPVPDAHAARALDSELDKRLPADPVTGLLNGLPTKDLTGGLLKGLPLVKKGGLPTSELKKGLMEGLPAKQLTGGLLKGLPLTKKDGGLTNALPTDQVTNGLLGNLPGKRGGLPLVGDLTEKLPTDQVTNGLLGKLPLAKKGGLPTDKLAKSLKLDELLKGLPVPLGKKSFPPKSVPDDGERSLTEDLLLNNAAPGLEG